MTSTFAERLAFGGNHENNVAELLIDREWEVAWWGVGTLADGMIMSLRGTTSRLCYEPDLIASRAGRYVEIECKGARSEGGGRAVPIVQLDVQRAVAAARRATLYYVLGDLTVATGDAVAEAMQRSGRRYRPGDSVIVPPEYARPFDAVFGTPPAGQIRIRG